MKQVNHEGQKTSGGRAEGVASKCSAQGLPLHVISGLRPVSLESIAASGDLYMRAERNYDRLEEEYYQPEHVLSSKMHAQWPGDLEGRAILGLVLLARATGRAPRYLKEIVAGVDARLNRRGYLGQVLEAGLCDEQQLSGHSWLVRGLCEYYLWKKDPAALRIFKGIVQNLFLPAGEYYKHYPSRAEQRVFQGEVAGSLTGDVHGNWYTSSDTGCAFIPLDGVTHAFEILQTEPLQKLAQSMISKFASIDFAGISMQTHSTLSGLRGMLRYYGMTGEPDVLDEVIRIFSLYFREAITENYANYNWFGRADWTEPCAIVDSFIVAVELWKYTGNAKYLDDAHHILFNALGYAQRPNGGWGPDECAGARWTFLRPTASSYEAPWCCTMRGAVGLARAISFSYFQNADHLVIPFYNNNSVRLQFSDGELLIAQKTDYPFSGRVQLEVSSSTTSSQKRISFFIPSWAAPDTVALSVNGRQVPSHVEGGMLSITTVLATSDLLDLTFELGLRQCPILNLRNIPGNFTLRHGPLILGITNPDEVVSIEDPGMLNHLGRGQYVIGSTGKILQPINDLFYMTDREARQNARQILFACPHGIAP